MKLLKTVLLALSVTGLIWACGSDDDDDKEEKTAATAETQAAFGGIANANPSFPSDDSSGVRKELRRQIMQLKAQDAASRHLGGKALQGDDFDICDYLITDQTCTSMNSASGETGQECTFTCGDSISAACTLEEQKSQCGDNEYTSSGSFDYDMSCTTTDGVSTMEVDGTIDMDVEGGELESKVDVTCEMTMSINLSASDDDSDADEDDDDDFDCEMISCKVNGTAISCAEMKEAANSCED